MTKEVTDFQSVDALTLQAFAGVPLERKGAESTPERYSGLRVLETSPYKGPTSRLYWK
jgi:hypothetical protein